MASPIYLCRVVEKSSDSLRVHLQLIHPLASEFGTDPAFAWKLLSRWVSPPDDAPDRVLAAKYIRRVHTSQVENGTVHERHATHVTVKRGSLQPPSMTYLIEVTDPSILAPILVGDADEFY